MIDEKNQRYACGFPFTDGAVLITRDKSFLFTDSRYIEAAGKSVSSDVELRLFGAGKRLSELIKTALSECGAESIGAEEESLPHAAYLRYESLLGCELSPAQSIFTELRASKSAEEQQYMRKAQAIAERVLSDVLGIIKPGITERDIAAEITYRLLKHGGEGNSFDPIAVTGYNSSMPHGVPGDTRVKAGDFVTMDFGCICNGYCSDMTRTVVIGKADDDMKKLYNTVLEAQLKAEEALTPGITGAALDKIARDIIDSVPEFKGCFGHSLGHGVGMYIHEAPGVSGGNDRPMKDGHVITIEPGIYLAGKYGCRIEDMAVFHNGSVEVITRCPKQLIEL